LTSLENRGSPGDAAKAAAVFREEAFRIFSAAGGVMIGLDGDLAVFAFGSPQERRAMVKMKSRRPYDDGDLTPNPGSPALQSPGAKAAELVIETLKNCPQAASWHFAIDAGECCFSWSEVSGFTAAGRAVVSARRLSGLTQRYKARVLVSGRITEKLGAVFAKKVGALVDQESGGREEFYELGSGEGE
jgi:class 3 adenylate cyclase